MENSELSNKQLRGNKQFMSTKIIINLSCDSCDDRRRRRRPTNIEWIFSVVSSSRHKVSVTSVLYVMCCYVRTKTKMASKSNINAVTITCQKIKHVYIIIIIIIHVPHAIVTVAGLAVRLMVF